ncbi:HoxN/HupN/NixA family nickel/cobalt transporter [Pseudomonas weihenstephanensis]|uniref:Nickel/cobalt efflux system n=1 Tax=Pseudomonas weihenstephanensis TaxID=1608994 RepID=A0A0J6J7Q2_9PSED|nr:HoxN/HupN/NixA family nickel/cobalt transporter [Pseudomonas weihenstephanensis]KMN12532.1 nickel transporter [Pseudomonas weihenstephanensis]KMN20517.1 nickel transporter [Pseudomonas weihenstephanensis]GLX90605.1 nickel/cobalt efflux system [Pseudomonas fragi]
MTAIAQPLVQTAPSRTTRNAIYLLIGLIVANALAWLWAFSELGTNPVLMGTALLAYSFGLRHAVDADHIAAIDNVTRKLMQQGKTPIAVGTYFSLGHSTIVVLASFAIAATAMAFKDDMAWFHETGGLIGTLVSSLFLLLFGVLNLVILRSVYKKFKQVKAGKTFAPEELDGIVSNNGGLMARLFRRVFNLVNKSWHMYPVGFLFGLGFDTATEIGLLGISATSASHGISLWSIMVFPVLFAVGMALIDSLDNFVMIGAYGWAFSKPLRKLYYNITITAASVVVALFIGGVEALGLIADKLELSGGIWTPINAISDHFGEIGYWIIGMFVLCWLISALNYYLRGYDHLGANA